MSNMKWKEALFLELVDSRGPLSTPLFVAFGVDGKVRLAKNLERATAYTSHERAMQALSQLDTSQILVDSEQSIIISSRAFDAEKHQAYWEACVKGAEQQQDWSHHWLLSQKYLQAAEHHLVNGPLTAAPDFIRKAINALMDVEIGVHDLVRRTEDAKKT